MASANHIAHGVWMGSAPGPHAALDGFDTLVLCASEWQPHMRSFKGSTLYRGFRDTDEPRNDELCLAERAGREVARRAPHGPVLVTCVAGRNRSGLVTGIALRHLGWPAARAVRAIQHARPNALSNPVFVDYLLAGG